MYIINNKTKIIKVIKLKICKVIANIFFAITLCYNSIKDNELLKILTIYGT